MADKRKGKKRKEEFPKEEVEKATKEEYAVASWLRKNIQTKKTKFLNHNVEYFTAVKAVDALMETHWAQAKEGEDAFWQSRQDAIDFMDMMLRHKFFHRAKKVPVSEAELKAKQKKKEGRKKLEAKEKDEEKTEDEVKETEDKEKNKKSRKIRLEMHMEQIFVDNLDAYVWIYDPIPIYYWFFGTLLVLGAIAICLFPLWPPGVRKGVYYLSIAAAGFLIFIIGLAVLRLLVFCIVWGVTLGVHHLWLFPNLTEDVGFMASFWPLYQYEYKGEERKKKKKDKESDNEEEDDEVEEVETEVDGTGEPSVADEVEEQDIGSESESESSQKSQNIGKDFEMVEKDDLDS